ncbi:TetR/AcrR family transcriptional regulator [Microbacterium luticocti]|uniref:TetR/AcrR family transcriptional regulator n=1 Tax=Microbacterium luticocti TaxID=451764 RepID=UPI00040034F2|nr:TetR/AcrR family transcriptional regulator [Microbacterium luticocti]
MVDAATAILDAALHEVQAHGIRRTTASDIARRAGVARQTLYRHWPDVQTLLAALVTRELVAVLPPPVPPGDLDALVDILVDTAERIRRMPLLARLRDSDPELLARYVLQRLGTSQHLIHDELAARIAAAQAAGVARAGDAAALAAMTLLIAQSAVLSAPLVTEWLDEEGWRRELAAALRGHLDAGGRR